MTLHEAVKQKLERVSVLYRDQICGGNAQDFAAYQRMVGRNEGLWLAFTEIEAILKAQDNGDELPSITDQK